MFKIEFANPKGDIHIIIRDSCGDLILYENVYAFETFHLKENEQFKFHCPTCNTEYILQKDEYKKAYEKFCVSES